MHFWIELYLMGYNCCANGLNPSDASDRTLDHYSDGITNLEEFLNGGGWIIFVTVFAKKKTQKHRQKRDIFSNSNFY
jgi:hypothetical protein